MQPLPRDFLTDTAREYTLSPEQEEAFVELYSGDGDEFEAAERLNLSRTALRTRMTGVYSKFSIGGKGPGKFYRLQVFLLERHRNTGEPLPEAAPTVDVSALVQDCRQKVKPLLQERCGTMRVLDMEQPIGLGQIYTSVNILKKLTGRRRLELSDFLEEFDPEDSERMGLGVVREQRVPGLKAIRRCQKLMVLGRPGAGKTTFLKYLAITCCDGTVLADHLPIFVPLKEFAETKGRPELLKYILWMFEDVSLADLSLLLQEGKIFFLLDGLDEMREEDAGRVTREIQGLADKHPGNQYVVTCRIAARDYTFQQFTEVEVADFDEKQIADFAHKWFHLKHPGRAEKFVERLEENKRIQELATNPLLLTLLCLIFEERGKFKDSRAELYEEGIELLLEKWDDSRDIEREQVYRRLRPQRKMELLSHIALSTFIKNKYFFKKKALEHLISTYIQNLPDVQNDPDGLLISSGKVLKSIEAQHGLLTERARGIYSFSHLTFQEYFTARQIASSNSEGPNQHLHDLVAHITEKRWREVFLLVPEILPNANSLMKLMKAQIDSLLAGDERLQPKGFRSFYAGSALSNRQLMRRTNPQR
ncbi:MAG: NACHT domain-containing protein [Elainellaceae cyanobacterium]